MKKLYVSCLYNAKSSSGFSLIELMIAIGIMSALAMGASDVFGTWVTYKKNVQANVVADQTQLEISALLTNNSLCLSNIGKDGANIKIQEAPTEAQADFKDSLGKPIVKIGSTIRHGTKLNKWHLTKTATLKESKNSKTILADLILDFHNTTANGALNSNSRTLKLVMKTNDKNEVTSCNLLSDVRGLASDNEASDETSENKPITEENILLDFPGQVACHWDFPWGTRPPRLTIGNAQSSSEIIGAFETNNLQKSQMKLRPSKCSGSGLRSDNLPFLLDGFCSAGLGYNGWPNGIIGSAYVNATCQPPPIVCPSNATATQDCEIKSQPD